MIFIGLLSKDRNKERNTTFLVNKIVKKSTPPSRDAFLVLV